MDRGTVLGLGILSAYVVLMATGVSWAEGSRDAEGSAQITVDGETATYPLLTGFEPDTSFDDPKRSTIVFSIADWGGPRIPRRIQLTLDATRKGARSTSGDRVFFKLIEEGGQHFPPKGACDIEIHSAYSGTPDGVFAGNVDDCRVASAGVEHVVSADFRMQGIPKRF